MVTLSQSLLHYKRKDIQKAIAKHAKDKEISGSFNMRGYSKRPDVIQYPTDVLEMAKRGITSFHCSEENWKTPLRLSASLKRYELDALRKGWDLLLDIDCKELEFSKLAAHYLVEALRYHDIKSVYTKFSGNHGFHIAVPFEAFPETVHNKEVRTLFPEAPRKIAEYLSYMIEPHLRKALLEKYTTKQISELIDKPVEEITKNGLLQPFEFLDVDTILIASRHLYRMPYSFNEKSGLVSIPIRAKDILTFQKPQALPKNIQVTDIPFIERDIEKHQAAQLFVEAFDFKPKLSIKKEPKIKKDFDELAESVPEDLFPPCILNILKGIGDGKKRATFILINFLSSLKWNNQQIEQKVREWNKNNTTPLKDVYLNGQLNSLRNRNATRLPPNCQNASYYKELAICQPDGLCQRIRNPVNYSRRRAFAKQRADNYGASNRAKLTEEQKAMRRAHRAKIKKEKEATNPTNI